MTQSKKIARKLAQRSPSKDRSDNSHMKRARSEEQLNEDCGEHSPKSLREGETVLSRLRRRALPAHPDMRQDLEEVAIRRRWSENGGSLEERVDRIASQVNLSAERDRPLKRRFLFAVAVFFVIYTFLVRSSLRAQYQQWVEKPHLVIGLTGIDGSYVIPLLFTFWYVVLCFLFSRLMANSQPVETLIFEVMVMYNVLQACMSFYIGMTVLQEVQTLGLAFVGNAWPSHREEDRDLAILAVLHYHLRILELLDTFFLILRKKIGSSSSLHLHVLLRLQNVWGWHVACRYGCGGDIYFPLVTNAVCSTILHMHYTFTLLEPRARQLTGFFQRLPSQHHLKRRSAVMAIQSWSFRLCLCYGLLSLFAGSGYPRLVLVVNILQCAFGVLLYSNFHYDPSSKAKEAEGPDADEHPAKLTFSFDSSGWCYFYHWGVGMWLQEHLADEIARGEIAWSGSSGGAIVACGMAQGLDVPAVLDSVMHRTWDRAAKKPWLIPEEVQYTLETFVPENGHELASNKLRVLLTRLSWKPPFVMGQVVSEFHSRSYLFDVLQASSHIPIIFGLGFLLDGVRYFDGMFWIGSIVPWRSFNSRQRVCRVSAFSSFGSDIGPRWFAIPPIWWAVFPPNREVLEGMTWAGYRDIASAFGSADGRSSGCGPCSRRQQSLFDDTKMPRRQISSERVDELIALYERKARKDWTIVFACVLLSTVCCWLAWVISISFSR